MANNTTQYTIKINGTDQIVDLNTLLNTTANSLDETKAKQQALEEAFSSADYGTAEFETLQAELQKVNTQIKVIDESVADLTIAEKFEGVGRIVGAVGGAFAFATVSVQAFGDENGKTAEQLQKLETQISAVIQGQQALTGIIDAFGSKNKIVAATVNGLSRAFTAMGISAKGSGLAVRGALIATGVGALIVGVGLLIENFDKLKSIGAGLFKSFQPFFNAIRNFASFATGGLISNTTTKGIEDTIFNINATIDKTIEQSNKKLETLRSKQTLGFETTLQNITAQETVQADAIKKIITDSSDGISELFSTIKKNQQDIGNDVVFPNLIPQLDAVINTFEAAFKDINKMQTDEALRSAKSELDIFKKLIGDRTVLEDLTNRDRKLILEELTKLEEVATTKQNERLDILNKKAEVNNKIGLRNLEIKDLQTKAAEADLQNVKSIIDLISSIEQLQDPTDVANNNVFLSYDVAIKDLLETVNNEEFKKIFSGDFLKKLQESRGESLFSGDLPQSLQLLKTYAIEVNKITNQEIENLANRTDLSVELKTTLADNLSTLGNTREEQKAIKDEVFATFKLTDNEFSIALDEIYDKYFKITGAVKLQGIEIQQAIVKQKAFLEQLNFEKQIESINRFKNGIKLSTDEIDNLAKILPDIDFTQALSLQTIEKQNEILNQIADKQIEIAKQKEIQDKKAATTAKEINAIENSTNAVIAGIVQNTQDNVNANNELLKTYNEQLDVLIQQEEVRKLQLIADNPNKSAKERKQAIKEIQESESKAIKDRFEKETKGLSETDERYKISIINRGKAEEELAIKTANSIKEINLETIQQVGDITSAVGSGIANIYAAQSAANDEAQAALEEQATIISDELSLIQESISILDATLNEKKAIIDELQASAEAAIGGQREAILEQLNKEYAAAQQLAQQKEKDIQLERQKQAQLKKNASEQEALQRKASAQQKEAAEVAKIFALAQAGVAVATAFLPDPASAAVPFGIGLAIRAAAAIAFVTQLYSLLAFADGGFIGDKVKSRAEGGFTGSSTLRPDSTGERPMHHTVQLHEKEWVAPRWMTESPKFGSVISELEQTRVRGFADGGSITPISTTQTNNNQELTNLLAANLNKPIYVAVTDINLGQSKVEVLEARAQL